jgi:hypothetical protein
MSSTWMGGPGFNPQHYKKIIIILNFLKDSHFTFKVLWVRRITILCHHNNIVIVLARERSDM